MGKRNGRQKGPQQHAEGQHGERTHQRFLEQLHEHGETQKATNADALPGIESGTHRPGGFRLDEGRIQNDPADRAADKNRAAHKHED